MAVLSVGSLFSGFGAFDIGFEWAGFQTIWQVEIEPWRRAILEKHFPSAERFEDVKTLAVDQLQRPDIIIGGPPCQDISIAGKRQGERGSRWLWPDTVRIVTALRPRWICFENPREFLSFRESAAVLSDLENAGYSIWILDIGAEDAGAPHRRRRIWIVGRLANAESQRSAGECLSVRSGRPLETALNPYRTGSDELADTKHNRRQWREPTDECGDTAKDACQRSQDVGNAPLLRCQVIPSEPDERIRTLASPSAQSDELGNPESHDKRREWQRQRRQQEQAGGSSSLLAYADIPRSQEHASEPGNPLQERPPAIRGRWPARPGEQQHEWEQPRVADASVREVWRTRLARQAADNGDIERILGCNPDRTARRLDRLASYHNREAIRAAGDSLIPQIAEAIARAILEMDRSTAELER